MRAITQKPSRVAGSLFLPYKGVFATCLQDTQRLAPLVQTHKSQSRGPGPAGEAELGTDTAPHHAAFVLYRPQARGRCVHPSHGVGPVTLGSRPGATGLPLYFKQARWSPIRGGGCASLWRSCLGALLLMRPTDGRCQNNPELVRETARTARGRSCIPAVAPGYS